MTARSCWSRESRGDHDDAVSNETWRRCSGDGEPVILQIYDLGKTFIPSAWNTMAKRYGAFHTALVIYGREWSYGMTTDGWSTGVTWNAPGKNPDHSFRESLTLGCTSLSQSCIWELLMDLRMDWLGCDYNLLTRNCHHFSFEFSRRLGVSAPPAWINDLAASGAVTMDYFQNHETGKSFRRACSAVTCGTVGYVDLFENIKAAVGFVLGVSIGSEDVPGQKQATVPLSFHKPCEYYDIAKDDDKYPDEDW